MTLDTRRQFVGGLVSIVLSIGSMAHAFTGGRRGFVYDPDSLTLRPDAEIDPAVELPVKDVISDGLGRIVTRSPKPGIESEGYSFHYRNPTGQFEDITQIIERLIPSVNGVQSDYTPLPIQVRILTMGRKDFITVWDSDARILFGELEKVLRREPNSLIDQSDAIEFFFNNRKPNDLSTDQVKLYAGFPDGQQDTYNLDQILRQISPPFRFTPLANAPSIFSYFQQSGFRPPTHVTTLNLRSQVLYAVMERLDATDPQAVSDLVQFVQSVYEERARINFVPRWIPPIDVFVAPEIDERYTRRAMFVQKLQIPYLHHIINRLTDISQYPGVGQLSRGPNPENELGAAIGITRVRGINPDGSLYRVEVVTRPGQYNPRDEILNGNHLHEHTHASGFIGHRRRLMAAGRIPGQLVILDNSVISMIDTSYTSPLAHNFRGGTALQKPYSGPTVVNLTIVCR